MNIAKTVRRLSDAALDRLVGAKATAEAGCAFEDWYTCTNIIHVPTCGPISHVRRYCYVNGNCATICKASGCC